MNRSNIPIVDGRLMRKMIDVEMPYWIQLSIIHHDNKEFRLDLGFIKTICNALQKTHTQWKALHKKWWMFWL